LFAHARPNLWAAEIREQILKSRRIPYSSAAGAKQYLVLDLNPGRSEAEEVYELAVEMHAKPGITEGDNAMQEGTKQALPYVLLQDWRCGLCA
jgi:hypothetical protein